MFIRFDRIYECDRRTNRQTARWHRLCLCKASCSKNIHQLHHDQWRRSCHLRHLGLKDHTTHIQLHEVMRHRELQPTFNRPNWLSSLDSSHTKRNLIILMINEVMLVSELLAKTNYLHYLHSSHKTTLWAGTDSSQQSATQWLHCLWSLVSWSNNMWGT